MKSNVESCHCLCVSISTNTLVLTHVHFETSLLYVHVESCLVEVLWQTESDFFFNPLVTDIMSPVVDLDKTAVAQIDKVDLKFVQVVLNKDKPINFFTTTLIFTNHT